MTERDTTTAASTMERIQAQSLSHAIKLIREHEGLSQAEFAARFERTQTWASYVESGKRDLAIADLEVLSAWYGLVLDGGWWFIDV